jgi:phosphoribosylpyrophosphate synthetase
MTKPKYFDPERFVVLGGNGNHDLHARIITRVNEFAQKDLRSGLVFDDINFDDHPDGEDAFMIPSFERLRGRHLILFQTMYGTEPHHGNDYAREFLTTAWAATKQYGAKDITAVVPFLRYRRQDHPEDHSEEIHRNLELIEDMANRGVKRLILCDIHSPQTLKNCEASGIQAWNVSPAPAFADNLKLRVALAAKQNRPFRVYSPDENAIPRGISLAKELGVEVAVTLKKRSATGSVSMVNASGSIDKLIEKHQFPLIVADESLRDNTIAIIDDEWSTGGTARMNALYLKNELGVQEVLYCATHAVCASGWKSKMLSNNPFDLVLLGDTIEKSYEKSTAGVVTRVSMARLIAQQLFMVLLDI